VTQEHPITPPPELVQQWREAPEFSALSPCVMVTVTTTKLQDIATQAAQWGADQELEVCCEWIAAYPWLDHPELLIKQLRAARRPKPPSLKEQALATLEEEPDDGKELLVFDTAQVNIIRRALEALPE